MVDPDAPNPCEPNQREYLHWLWPLPPLFMFVYESRVIYVGDLHTHTHIIVTCKLNLTFEESVELISHARLGCEETSYNERKIKLIL